MGNIVACFKHPPLEKTLARAERFRKEQTRYLGLTSETLQEQADDLLREVAAEVSLEQAERLAHELPDVPK